MAITINFDLDGTLYDLYGLENWLSLLRNEQEGAFTLSFPLFGAEFYVIISNLLAKGVIFNVITWLPMGASKEYEEICTREKREWCKNFLPFITNFTAQPYGVPKQKGIVKNAQTEILIDDNIEVCKVWETQKRRKYYQVTKEKNVTQILQEIYNEYFGDLE